jgi:ribosomal protein L16 Arg81 hydroxylase
MAAIVQQELNPEPEESGNTLKSEDLDARIAELAYLKAESRSFEPGHELEDWLEAEQELMLNQA